MAEKIIFNGIFVKRKENNPEKWPKYYSFYCFKENDRASIVDVFGLSHVENLIITPKEISFRKIYLENIDNHLTKTVIDCHAKKHPVNIDPHLYTGTWSLRSGRLNTEEQIAIHHQESPDSIFRLHALDQIGKEIFNGDFLSCNIRQPRIKASNRL